MRYQPKTDPASKDKSTSQIHHDIDDITGDGYNGISCQSGTVNEITGDLSESDLSNIADYLGVEIVDK